MGTIIRTIKDVDIGDAIFAIGATGMCLLLDWDKNAVKCFISGGVIAAWVTMRIMQLRRHASRQD